MEVLQLNFDITELVKLHGTEAWREKTGDWEIARNNVKE